MEASYENGNTESAPLVLSLKKQNPILIHPASETQKGLYFLSNLDQADANTPVELVFVFNQNQKWIPDNATEILKESLAKTLVEFYPFAGCLTTTWDDKIVVQCGSGSTAGEGVPFVEAVSDNEIQVLGDISVTDPTKLRKLVHFVEGALRNSLNKPLLTVQVTRFKCGGIAVGVGLNHVICDNKSLMDFIISWSEIARSGNPSSVFHPFLDRSLLFPRQPLQIHFHHHEFSRKEEEEEASADPHFYQSQPLLYRSFCFDPQKLAQLKKMAKDDDHNNYLLSHPTSFEVIAALVWVLRTKAFMFEPHEIIKLLIVADARAKFKPPLPKGFFGNVLANVCAKCSAGEVVQKPFPFAVKMVQEAIKMVTEEYVRSAIDYYEATRGRFVETWNTCYISKLSRLPFYETDFGWGKPAQVAPAVFERDAILIFSQGKDSKNMVVSLSLPQSAMNIFQELMHLELQQK